MGMGIYKIVNTANGKLYVGSATDLNQRRKAHFSKLRSNGHPSRHLQASFNKHGETAFSFVVVEEVHEENVGALVAREQHWITLLRPAYNKRLVAESNVGMAHTAAARQSLRESLEAYRRTPQGLAHKEKLREATKASWVDPETRQKRLDSIKAAWTPEKRAEAGRIAKARVSHVLPDGTFFGTKRIWTEEEKAKMGAKQKGRWETRAPVSEDDIRQLVTATNAEWEAVEMTGVRNLDKVLIRCKIHHHEQWQTIAKVKYEKRGCKLCGFARSSEVQKGRPKHTKQV